jgi:hypothetical protein
MLRMGCTEGDGVVLKGVHTMEPCTGTATPAAGCPAVTATVRPMFLPSSTAIGGTVSVTSPHG